MTQAVDPQPIAAVTVRRRGHPFHERIERCWDWLEHWGHPVERVGLSRMSSMELLDLAFDTERRVKVLAESWETWW